MQNPEQADCLLVIDVFSKRGVDISHITIFYYRTSTMGISINLFEKQFRLTYIIGFLLPTQLYPIPDRFTAASLINQNPDLPF